MFIEWLLRSVKYEEVWLHAYENGSEARAGLTEYVDIYNGRRMRHLHDYLTPDAVYFGVAQRHP